MTCTAKVAGSSSFYIVIYANGQTYQSNTVTVSIGATSPRPSVSQVQGLTATANGSSANLSWSSVPVSSGNPSIGVYNIYRSTTSGFSANSGNMIAQVNANSWTDASLPGTGTYYYEVAAQDTTGAVGPASSAASVSVGVAPSPSASLSLTESGAAYPNFVTGGNYTLQMSSNQPSSQFQLCATFVPGAGSTGTGYTNGCAPALSANSTGGYSWNGSWDTSVVGTWTEWVQFGKYTSPTISFTVVAPGAAQVTVTSPVSGQTFTPGSTMTVQWTPTSAGITEIDMVPTDGSYPTHGHWLYQGGGNTAGYPNSPLTYGFGSPLPSNIPPGSYYIAFYASGTLIGQSGIFTVETSVVPPPLYSPNASLNLTASGDSYPNFHTSDHFTLQMTSNVPYSSFQLCSNFAPANGSTGTGHQGQCVPVSSSDSSGDYNWTGSWDSSTIGTWTEWVQFGSYTSPSITFTIAAPTITACPMFVPYCPYGSHTVPDANGCNQTICNPAPVTVSPSASLNLTASGDTYPTFRTGDSFVLQMTSNQLNTQFYLCSNFTPGQVRIGANGHTNQCIASPLTTDSSGDYNWTGSWDSSTIGTWTEWVQLGSYTSPTISFTIAAPAASFNSANSLQMADTLNSVQAILEQMLKSLQ